MSMSLESLIIVLLIGGIAGWLAGLIMKGRGFGILGNIVVGILGAFVGSWLLGLFGVVIGGGIIGAILNAMIGAIFLLFVISLIKRA
jgi:uncharacterized membrane protein YeaQ/YmgE (transglycosylase-associated protein family)